MDPPPSNHPDSANSSPRSRPDTTTWDADLPPIPGGPKLRLMCSYGGHIIPRPHDKSLCYVGGDTRIMVVDRHSSLGELYHRLSHTLLNGRHFTLKYQLPTEDLDSLISLTSDEDIENMIEEYDRTTSAASPLKPSRLRLFLFPYKPETAASMGSLLDDAKSETWFVDALNGAGLLPRGFSESAAIDTLLELDHGSDLEQNEPLCNNKHEVVAAKSNAQEVAVLDYSPPPAVETSSSFGSSSSSPSMANLPPIKVRGVEDNLMVGLDEQFSRGMNIAPSLANATPPPVSVAGNKSVGGDDDKSEKSDHGTVVPTGLRKPPLPLQLVPRKLVDVHNLPSPDSKYAGGGGYNFPSPDSVASDCSIASAGSQSKNTVYNDTTKLVNRENRVPTPVIDPKTSNIQDPSSHIVELSSSISESIAPSHQHQHQFIPSTHYIQHTAMPMSSYYPMYLHPQTQQTDPQYPLYLLPHHTQNQPSYDAPMVTTSHPLTSRVYSTNTEMETNMHQMGSAGAGAATPMLVQVPAHQYQQQYSQMPPQLSNAAAASASAGGSNYGYQCFHHMQDQTYYAQQQLAASAPPPQYQTMNQAAAVMYTQASSQILADSNT